MPLVCHKGRTPSTAFARDAGNRSIAGVSASWRDVDRKISAMSTRLPEPRECLALSGAPAPRESSRRGRAPWERGALHPPRRKMRVRSLAIPAFRTPPCSVADRVLSPKPSHEPAIPRRLTGSRSACPCILAPTAPLCHNGSVSWRSASRETLPRRSETI